MREVLGDLGLGIGLLLLSTVLASFLGGHQRGGAPDDRIAHLIPQTSLELVFWMVVSLIAGICEEAVYRGYLQRQFSALCRNVPAGIVLSAATFGAAHLYQGIARASVIAASGVLFGWFAYWRKSVRPGMVAHTLQDAVAPLLLRAMRRKESCLRNSVACDGEQFVCGAGASRGHAQLAEPLADLGAGWSSSD